MTQAANSTICVDASVAVSLLVTPNHPVQALWHTWVNSQVELICPALLPFEVVNAIHQYQRHGRITSLTALQLVGTLSLLPLNVRTPAQLYERAMQLATTYGASATYAAHYVALASLYGAELWTCDRRLATRFVPAYSAIHVIE